jgi:CheY-like chemotaxis protein
MQHLIKRSARNDNADGMTLAERLAASRQAANRVMVGDADEPDYDVEEAFVAGEAVTAPAVEAPVQQHDPGGIEAVIRAAKAARDGAAPNAAVGKTCLVVDDSRVIRKVASAILTGLGYSVTEAENGEEALARCQLQMPALILTDWQMPVMDGPAFVTALRQLPEARGTKVVFCTSKGEVADIHAGIGAGADDYIVKPFDEATVQAKLAKLGLI